MNSRGFTLIEAMVTIGISLALAAIVLLPMHIARTPLTATTATFSAMLLQSRTVAEQNDGAGSGALLVVRPSANGSTLEILLNRPLRGFESPSTVRHMPVAVLPMRLTIDDGARDAFTLAFAPNGQLDLIPAAVTPDAAPIDAEPGCSGNADNRLRIRIGEPGRNKTIAIDCDRSVIADTN